MIRIDRKPELQVNTVEPVQPRTEVPATTATPELTRMPLAPVVSAGLSQKPTALNAMLLTAPSASVQRATDELDEVVKRLATQPTREHDMHAAALRDVEVAIGRIRNETSPEAATVRTRAERLYLETLTTVVEHAATKLQQPVDSSRLAAMLERWGDLVDHASSSNRFLDAAAKTMAPRYADLAPAVRTAFANLAMATAVARERLREERGELVSPLPTAERVRLLGFPRRETSAADLFERLTAAKAAATAGDGWLARELISAVRGVVPELYDFAFKKDGETDEQYYAKKAIEHGSPLSLAESLALIAEMKALRPAVNAASLVQSLVIIEARLPKQAGWSEEHATQLIAGAKYNNATPDQLAKLAALKLAATDQRRVLQAETIGAAIRELSGPFGIGSTSYTQQSAARSARVILEKEVPAFVAQIAANYDAALSAGASRAFAALSDAITATDALAPEARIAALRALFEPLGRVQSEGMYTRAVLDAPLKLVEAKHEVAFLRAFVAHANAGGDLALMRSGLVSREFIVEDLATFAANADATDEYKTLVITAQTLLAEYRAKI